MNNITSKNIDIKTEEGLDLLKTKAEYYGHYAVNLKVLELIEEVEDLRRTIDILKDYDDHCDS